MSENDNETSKNCDSFDRFDIYDVDKLQYIYMPGLL